MFSVEGFERAVIVVNCQAPVSKANISLTAPVAYKQQV
jgi:hypothetical protein